MVAPKMYDPPRWQTDEWLQLSCRNIHMWGLSGQVIHVKIEKDAEIDRTQPKRLMARTWGYSYQANLSDGTQLIRYDSPDLNYVGIGFHQGFAHHAYHHLHDFTNGKEVVQKVTDGEWPHVGEFLTEVRQRF